MNELRSIQYLSNDKIDKAKWDHCIETAANGLIYAYSWYLDKMADHWDGIVMGDYEMVMPLPWRRKMGIFYLYQPAFVAQLGLFGNGVSKDALVQFFAAIPGKFKYWDMPLNMDNKYDINEFHLNERANFILRLHKPYNELYKGYRENNRRNIKRAQGYSCVVKTGIDLNEIIALANDQPQQGQTLEQDFAHFRTIYDELHQEEKARSYGVYSSQGQLLASCALLYSHNRWYYLLVGNHPNGRTLGASHLLIDAIIKDLAGKNVILDFEGSDIRNLAFFYSGFGGHQENYTTVRLNRLPWYLKWAKA